jgi:hypothetical protein
VQRIKEIKELQQKIINTQINNTAQPIMINAIDQNNIAQQSYLWSI